MQGLKRIDSLAFRGPRQFIYKGLHMFVKLSKYFLFFIVSTLTIYGAVDQQKRAADEEIKDTIVVHGMVLYGKIMKFGPERLSFKLLYSDGVNHIKYKDIESINTEYTYHISFKRIDIEGRIVGLEDHEYIKVLEGEKSRTIKISDIDNVVISELDDGSFENRVRNKFPYTKGNINVGLETESGTNNKDSVDIMLNLRRKLAEHEFLFNIEYAFETTQAGDSPEVESEDELTASLMYKNHFANNQFLYSLMIGEYDRPRHIKDRYIPSVGYGYRFRLDRTRWLEPSIGLAYTMTEYTETYPDNDFVAGAFGLSGAYQFENVPYINSLIIDGGVLYFPSIEDMNNDWIFRSNLNFTVPLFDFFSVKLALGLTDDSNPDPEVGNNKETAKLLFGLEF